MGLVAATLIRYGTGETITEYEPGENLDELPAAVKDELKLSGSAIDVSVWMQSNASGSQLAATLDQKQAEIDTLKAQIAALQNQSSVLPPPPEPPVQ